MKRLLFQLCLPVFLLARETSAATPADPAWRAVDDAMKQNLPQTALDRLKPLEAEAVRERAWGRAARAIALRVSLESRIQGGQPAERIQRYIDLLPTLPAPLQPVFHTLLGHAYWTHFQENRWQLQQRTALANSADAGADFRTWDLRRLFTEIQTQYEAALADPAVLQATPIETFDAFLERGVQPDSHRPTLFDFLTHEALDFYTAGEQAGARPEDAFVVPVESPILSDPDAFIAWRPPTTDTNSPAVRAITLFQTLLRFHQPGNDPTAFLAADLDRIRYGHNVATGPDVDARYLAALRRFIERAGRHPVAAEARHDLARHLWQHRDPVQAHALATETIRGFPDTLGARQCANLVGEIEAREVRIETERVWQAPATTLSVRYRNLTKVWFRAVRADWEQFLDRRQRRPNQLNPDQRRELLARPAALEWTHDLPATTDYKERHVEFPAPATLPPGFYFIFASHRADFSPDDNVVSSTDVWVSDLALVVRPRTGTLEGFVLDARTGEPLSGASVDAWYLGNDGARVAVPAATTDAEGFFAFTGRRSERGYLLRARLGSRQVALDNDVWWPRSDRVAARTQETLFFTDRALYRPGQLIQYKGICVRHGGSETYTNTNYRVLRGREVTVVLRDPNGKEVARQKHTANDYGSFAGAFAAPRDRLNGNLTLAVEGEPSGAIAVQVEEYKRPKFHVTLDAPASAARLDDSIEVRGRALAYTGAAIDGAKVTWRVTRQTRLPVWWEWFRRGSLRFPRFGDSQELAHGTTLTATDGSFGIQFVARPDPTVPEADEPTFHFEVHADITDATGETRSDERTVRVGYAALQPELTANSWQVRGQPVAITVTTRSPDDQPLPAQGTLKIHRLVEPDRVPRTSYHQGSRAGEGDGDDNTDHDPADPNAWPLGPVVAEAAVRTAESGVTTNRFDLAPGLYRAVFETRDAFGKAASARLPLRVLDPAAPRFGLKLPQVLDAATWEIEPGGTWEGLWGTGFDDNRAFIEIEHRGRSLHRAWTQPGRTQQTFQLAVTEALRGGVDVHVTQVREHRAYFTSRRLEVPWNNTLLDLRWETFRSKLEPGTPETWTVVIQPKRPTPTNSVAAIPAEMVATLYDASLDQFLEHHWPEHFGFWPSWTPTFPAQFSNSGRPLDVFQGGWALARQDDSVSYRHFPPEITENGGRHFFGMTASRHTRLLALADAPAAAPMAMSVTAESAGAPGRYALAKGAAVAETMADSFTAVMADGSAAGGGGLAGAPKTHADPRLVSPRRNLQETAFFLPQLTTDTNGRVRLTFTLPEALTEWRFLGFAHDRQLRSGFLSGRTVTAKDLMVQPNPPRFLREGDELEFTAKISNQSSNTLSGRVRLELAFATDGANADTSLGNAQPERDWTVPTRESRTLAWRLRVPDGCGFLRFKVVATADRHSDGEEGYLPVLSRRIFLTESLPLPLRGPGTKSFKFERLANLGNSRSLVSGDLTIQMVSQPAWYAVLALPYLAEFPHECAEQLFNRFYANALAGHIANSDPRIRRIFDQWRLAPGPALASPLESNADLKSVVLEETPWLRDATQESESRRRLGLLFEQSQLQAALDQTLRQLNERQLPDGGWSWFPGGPRDEFITRYIVTGFGRLRRLGVAVDVTPAVRALPALDAALSERFRRIQDQKLTAQNNLDPLVSLHLYGRTFFLADQPVPDEHRPAFDYFVGQAIQHWPKLGRQAQAHVALALNRLGNRLPETAATAVTTILRSLKENSVHDEELGRYWRDQESAWYWYQAPVESQALMIEAFAEIAHDAETVDACQVWLLKQKQTRAWKSTKATADAIYALLLRGTNLLSSDAIIEVSLGGRSITPSSRPNAGGPGNEPRPPAIEPGTGFYQVRIPAAEVSARLADIVLRKTDPGVAWGSAHWQYFEDLDQVRPPEGNPLRLSRQLFVRQNTKAGQTLEPIRGPVKVGDELIVRLELRIDRDLEYVHLKDQRGSGTEPVEVLSGYRFQGGLGYYESTRDTATHFFLGYLPKGTHVLEYPVRVQHRGTYSAGLAQIECLYAPEFNSHSTATTLVVQ